MAVFPLSETRCASPIVWLMVCSRGPQVGGISTASVDYQLIWEIPFHPLQSIGIVLLGHSALTNEKVQIFPAKPPFGSAWVVSGQGIGRRKRIERVLFFCCFVAYVSLSSHLLWSMDYPIWEDRRRRRRRKWFLTCQITYLTKLISGAGDLSGLRIRSQLPLPPDPQTGTNGRRRMVIRSLIFSCHFFSSYSWLPQFMQNLSWLLTDN